MISHDMTSRVHCYAMLCFALGKQYLGVTSQTLSHKPSVIEPGPDNTGALLFMTARHYFVFIDPIKGRKKEGREAL